MKSTQIAVIVCIILIIVVVITLITYMVLSSGIDSPSQSPTPSPSPIPSPSPTPPSPTPPTSTPSPTPPTPTPVPSSAKPIPYSIYLRHQLPDPYYNISDGQPVYMAVDGYPVISNIDGTLSAANNSTIVPTMFLLNLASSTSFYITDSGSSRHIGCISGGTPITPSTATATLSTQNTTIQFFCDASSGVAKIYIPNVPSTYYVISPISFPKGSTSRATAPVVLNSGSSITSAFVAFYYATPSPTPTNYSNVVDFSNPTIGHKVFITIDGN